jgi:hypothetical protein
VGAQAEAVTVAALWRRVTRPIVRAVERQERERVCRIIDRAIEEVRAARIPPNAKVDACLALLNVRTLVKEGLDG